MEREALPDKEFKITFKEAVSYRTLIDNPTKLGKEYMNKTAGSMERYKLEKKKQS